MAYGLIYEFPGSVGKKDYDAVNEKLGIDGSDPNSAWPAGLLVHSAGVKDDGGFTVFEVWESKASQEAFMADRLGAALGTTGIPAPERVIAVDLINHQVIA